MSDFSPSVAKKILKVMEKVQYLQKDEVVSYKNINYRALSEEKITSEVRKYLIEFGLVIIPYDLKVTQLSPTLTQVEMKYKLIDTDTGEYEIINVGGQGADTQDKGIGKALTYAYKYALRQTFAIPTGDDPDRIASKELDDQQMRMEQEKVKLISEVNKLASQLSNQGRDMNGIFAQCQNLIRRSFTYLEELNKDELEKIKQLLSSA